MRKFYKVTNCSTGDWSLVLADGRVDALSYYRKKNNVERSITLDCSDVFVHNGYKRYQVTKLSELHDNELFCKALPLLGICGNTPMFKLGRVANGMVRCMYLYDTIRPYSYLKGSTYVTIIPEEEQKCLKSGTE